MNYIEEYYNARNEDGRLTSKHGSVEYLTTMKYIRESVSGVDDPAILEVGAGTGRYSVTLAKEGYRVTAVELVEHNLEILKSKLDGTEKITPVLGNALDLSFLPDGAFDLTMLLGPMYHLYTKEDKLRVLSEAVRVTKPGGRILVAYCMNEATVIQYVFGLNNLREVMDQAMLTPDWHCKSEPKEVFELIRSEEIAELDAEIPVKRLKLVATDGATNYMRGVVDEMDDETFAKWLDFHFSTCERQDLVGASNHTLDILERIR
ncbi:MAG: methyltransferase domain-containing protein [Clostridia bacterium]|nr:methyltransferase domain-containing protein [Clostridia bacterium]